MSDVDPLHMAPLLENYEMLHQWLALALASAVALISTAQANGEVIATCHSPIGRAYFPSLGATPPSMSRWEDDKARGATITITRDQAGFDVTFRDLGGHVRSSRADGALVTRRMGDAEAQTFEVFYEQEGVVELYSPFRDHLGKRRLIMMQNRIGGTAAVPKAAVLLADCG